MTGKYPSEWTSPMNRRRKAWEVAYLRDRAAGRARYVDPGPTRARLVELAAAHVPVKALARAAGISDAGIKDILDGSRQHVQRATAVRVAALSLQRIYDEQAVGHVPRIGAVRRVQALMAMGWTHHAIAAAGAPSTGNLLHRPGHLVSIDTWRQIRDVYDRLSMTPGPSARTRARSRARGYAPPLTWDERTIDDPTARPQGDLNRGPGADIVDIVAVRRAITTPGAGDALTPHERTEAIRLMAEAGLTDTWIAERLGLSERTVLRARQRDDISPGQPASWSLEWAEAAATAARSRTTPNDHQRAPTARSPAGPPMRQSR